MASVSRVTHTHYTHIEQHTPVHARQHSTHVFTLTQHTAHPLLPERWLVWRQHCCQVTFNSLDSLSHTGPHAGLGVSTAGIVLQWVVRSVGLRRENGRWCYLYHFISTITFFLPVLTLPPYPNQLSPYTLPPMPSSLLPSFPPPQCTASLFSLFSLPHSSSLFSNLNHTT